MSNLIHLCYKKVLPRDRKGEGRGNPCPVWGVLPVLTRGYHLTPGLWTGLRTGLIWNRISDRTRGYHLPPPPPQWTHTCENITCCCTKNERGHKLLLLLQLLCHDHFAHIFLCLCRTSFYVSGGSFFHYGSRPSGDWLHVVINFHGPNNGKGFKTYFNGNLRISDTTKSSFTTTPSNGRVVIGRFFAELDNYYTSMDVDETLFFNRTLTTQEINSLYNI